MSFGASSASTRRPREAAGAPAPRGPGGAAAAPLPTPAHFQDSPTSSLYEVTSDELRSKQCKSAQAAGGRGGPGAPRARGRRSRGASDAHAYLTPPNPQTTMQR